MGLKKEGFAMAKGGITVPANNMIRLTDNGVILMLLTGQQTKDSVAELVVDLAVVIEKMHSQNKPALVLTDMDHMVHSPQAPEAAAEAMKVLSLPFDAMAICNSNVGNLKLTQELTAKADQQHVRTFSTAKQAAHWLAVYMNKHPHSEASYKVYVNSK
jgi:hypothetical protein